MALIWQKRSRDKLYEVRQAGASTRLYTSGVFHSQFNHRCPVTDNLWNMLALPAYFHEYPRALQRVLVLGVGGGAVMRHLLDVAPNAKVVGVDLDATHLHVAKNFFGVKGTRIRLVHAEAVQWLGSYSGPKFDVIIDDLFGETLDAQQLPQRAVPVSEPWLHGLQQQLAPGGVLGFNLESGGQCRKLMQCVRVSRSSPFVQLSQISHSRYDNAVAALLPRKLTLAKAHRALSIEPTYQRWLSRKSLPYRIGLRMC